MVDITQRINTAAGIHGTEAWMAPERFDRLNMDRTYAMDVYAYGCICYMVKNSSKRVLEAD
jgi:serine/threonine protein kinase